MKHHLRQCNYIYICILALLSPIRLHAGATIDPLLKELDRVIANKEEYLQQRQNRNMQLQARLNSVSTDRERWDVLDRLFQQYRNYSMDTLLIYARQSRVVARSLGIDSLQWRAVMMEAEALKGLGNYDDALRLLDSIPAHSRPMMRPTIFNRYISVYYSLYDTTYPRDDADRYRRLLLNYRDSLIAYFPEGHPSQLLNLAEKARVSGHPKLAGAYVDSLYAMDSDISPAVLDYIKANALMMTGNNDSAKIYLARSAISDISDCVRKYESLQQLAHILCDEGDVDRAYNYIMCSVNDVQASNTRSRLNGVIESLPVIVAAREAATREAEQSRQDLVWTFGIMLLVLLLVLALLAMRQRKLNSERAVLAANYAELERLKEQLHSTNNRLAESTRIKEEYIGYLFALCSEYIDSIEKYRLQLIRKLKSGRVSDIETALQSSQSPVYLKSFFEKFDSVFLDLFPDFVERFNSLMKPGHALTPHDGELLTPELRIYALVRLGINDSTKIAAFLHYSVQTVYNYRLRVRNNSIIDKTEFVSRVQSL